MPRSLQYLALAALALLLAGSAAAQQPGSAGTDPVMEQLMDRLGAVASELGRTSTDLERMYRLDKNFGRVDAHYLLALSWAADAGHRTGHDSFLTLSALRVDPDLNRESYIFHMLQLQGAKDRVDHMAQNLDDFETLDISDEDRPAVESLRAELLELQAIFAELGRILELNH